MNKLYLMRHGHAKTKDEDPNRPLNKEGRVETGQISRLLKDKSIKFDRIIHSAKQRAKDTALIVNEITKSNCDLIEKEELHPTDDPSTILDFVSELGGNILLVGHLPHLGKLSGLLTFGTTSHQPVKFAPSTIIKFERDNEDTWQILWSIPPKMTKE